MKEGISYLNKNIKNFSEEELIIYKYLTEKDKPKIKLDLKDKISEIKKLKDLIPKAEENEQKITENLIKEYFEEKENKNVINDKKEKKINNIIYSVDSLLNDKEIIEKKIKDKKEAIELLNEINNLIKEKIINPNLIQKINANNCLCRNQELKNYLSKIFIDINNFQEKEDLTEEQKIIVSFRNLIKNSFQEAKDSICSKITILNFFQDLEFKNIDLEKIINENEGINDKNSCKDEKIMEFTSSINITPSFDIFLKELHKYNPYNSIIRNNQNIFYKTISLLISIYKYFYSNIDSNNDTISIKILIHNNLEFFTYLLNYYILFYNNCNNSDDKNIESINKSLINIVIKIKNISMSMVSQVMADFNSKLIEQIEEIGTFEKVRKEEFYDFSLKKVQKSIKMIFNFLDELINTAIHREIIFYFNNILTIYFNSLNQKILSVSSYDIKDIQALLNISQEILKIMKKNFEKISGKNMDLGVKFLNILEQNLDYLRFQEILFILNSNLKQIKNYLISQNCLISITKEQFKDLLTSTFVDSEKLREMIKYINENVKEKKQN